MAAVSASALPPRQISLSPAPRKGDRGVAIADPAVPQPPGRSCVVTLYSHKLFGPHGDPTAMSAHPYKWNFNPPKNCSAPWSKVVMVVDFSVAPGRQYDRTASIWMDGVNLFFGTTQEPSADVSPHWRIERNLTDYSSLFRHPGKGQVILNNWVNPVDNSVISSTARLIFYPSAKGADAPTPADRVYGLDDSPRGAPVNVQNSHQALSRTLILPRNVERVYLDIIAQSQATDEQWYMCVDDADLEPTREYSLGPPASGDPLEQCGNTSFREVEVTIDGQPAGLAPVYPWTYTGGVDPYLWRPTPDIQTLNFVPYRLNLTPFAALLDNGHPHTVSVRVIRAHHFFSLSANLLVFLDHNRKALTGHLIRNTLSTQQARIRPRVQHHWTTSTHGGRAGTINTTEQGDYIIAGVLNTSRGPIRTQVQQQSFFSNRQRFLHPSATVYHQIINQDTQVTNTVTTSRNGSVSTHLCRLHYPLLVDVTKSLKPDGSFTAAITMRQSYIKHMHDMHSGQTVFWSTLDNTRDAHDTVHFNATGTALSNSFNQYGSQHYRFSDSLHSCYSRRVDARDGEVTSVASGKGCPDGVNHLHWRSRPNAM